MLNHILLPDITYYSATSCICRARRARRSAVPWPTGRGVRPRTTCTCRSNHEARTAGIDARRRRRRSSKDFSEGLGERFEPYLERTNDRFAPCLERMSPSLVPLLNPKFLSNIMKSTISTSISQFILGLKSSLKGRRG